MLQSVERKNILVAGGAGFIGSHLCDFLLSRGDYVSCVDSFITGSRQNIQPLMNHPRFRLIEKDISDFEDFDEPIQQIYNLACAASPPQYQADPVHTMMTCVNGTAILLKVAERRRARFLQASTSEVYGDPLQHPQQEAYWGNVNCTGPRACYDEGKRASETLCFDLLRLGRVDARVARIFNTYGPRMQRNDGRIVSNLVVQALEGRPLTIYGTGQQTRSFCYVSDLVAGLVQLMDASPNPQSPLNLGNPGELTILELAHLVLDMIPTSSEIEFRPLPQDDPTRRRPDITRAKQVLNWCPAIPLHEGLRRTIEWFATTSGEMPQEESVLS
ncbi:UDP-glucuronic acid decarboxylase family protein [Limoniibacter endophyticus]|uniref:NAD-dependent dehydratase n=1 Tax=Limoniibacter endophyticus TaxID=1565040 RepID=A0A8J3DJ39_9HYPH|nr:UDP-glucuronic acid decarboxylase family protein [Limoniibacter endophyticus]GHC72349.1 NAD-dependent dehydratase [Limoniibacter endophyticus]